MSAHSNHRKVPPRPTDKTAQASLDAFWGQFITKSPTKVTSILPQAPRARPKLAPHAVAGPVVESSCCRLVSASYEVAAASCRKMVDSIIRQCHLTNEKFTDSDFDLESDFNWTKWNCLHGLLDGEKCSRTADPPKLHPDDLVKSLDTILSAGILSDDRCHLSAIRTALSIERTCRHPASVHRVDYIFEAPSFCLDGYSFSDVRQGSLDNCWWLSAVSTICNVPTLAERVCVKYNEKCGVYGFVFYRDGEWTPVVVDDNLYLSAPDFDGDPYDSSGERERAYRKERQTGSEALYFGRCEDKNETWLPLMEKAFAKMHGDYDALNGGTAGAALEDLTGGVTTMISLNKILDRDLLWEQLTLVNKEFLYVLSTPPSDADAVSGLTTSHAYSIVRATEETGEDGNKVRLVLIR
jgi:hypothetical protein